MDTLTTATVITTPTEFQIDTVHTRPRTAPYFTGHRITANQPGPDPHCSLRLHLRPEPDGYISILLTADDPHTYGMRHPLAAWNKLPASSWTTAVAPTVATHPWAAHTRHRPARRQERPGNKILRAALAHILTH